MAERPITAMPDGFTPAVPFDACFDAVYGLEVVHEDVAGEGVARARVPVGEHLHTDGDTRTGACSRRRPRRSPPAAPR